jgi:integrase
MPTKFEQKIFQVAWELKKQGKSPYTIQNVNKGLKVLAKHCNLDKPEQVRGFIAQYDRKDGYKRRLVYSYDKYIQVHNLQWKKPIYWQPQRLPKIPLEQDINAIISNASKKLATAISISKDTGLRPIELTNLTLKHLDLNKGIIYPESAKHGTPRALKLKKATLNLLNNYIETKNLNINDKIFGNWDSNQYGKYFRYTRNSTAKKLAKPSIKTIRLYDLRHFFATMLYRQTREKEVMKEDQNKNDDEEEKSSVVVMGLFDTMLQVILVGFITLLPAYNQQTLLNTVGGYQGYVAILLSLLGGLLILIIGRGQYRTQIEQEE